MTPGLNDVEWMLEYPLLQAKRYGRPVSLVLVESQDARGPEEVLRNTIRESDVFFRFNGSLGAILMTETNARGALTAISRYKTSVRDADTLRFSVGCGNPEEDRTASHFLSTVYRSLKAAHAAGEGAAVADG